MYMFIYMQEFIKCIANLAEVKSNETKEIAWT